MNEALNLTCEFENIMFSSKEEAKQYIDRKKIAYVHEMRILAAIIREWSNEKIAVFSEGIIKMPDTVSPMLSAHIQKTYKRLDDIKQSILNIDADFYNPKTMVHSTCP